ncbi:methylated-DNA--[protein]-cysteine S-methyltransferase [Adlercreutzia sp. ZJ304]|uniref:methylated-DNA--[protein]-cysteine S-methyltransferase n=1 Tax=Adlercreutzia sp. ZJ304 TaxID=2709791 RepID=UPI0013EAB06C|nr:methylated-DNA--[protein]-cysteine S-methyltransferase [Adlercreutzia sp. ZJ304]
MVEFQIYESVYKSEMLGDITVASDGKNIVGLWLSGQKYFEATIEGTTKSGDELPVIKKTKKWLDSYFAGENPPISDLPLAPNGSTFRKRVWKKLCAIAYGQTRTYGDIAAELAREDGKTRMSAQAVGGAVGHNPISIIIPCHRVVGANGNLTGYAGGIDKKIYLLKHEGAYTQNMFAPKTGTAL